MILVFWMLSFKPTFSRSSFTFIKRLFSSSLSAIRVVSSAYLRLLIFLPAILTPACASSSSAFLMQCRRPRFDPWVREILLEEGVATYSSILAWRIPWTEEPGRLQSMGSQSVRRNWAPTCQVVIVALRMFSWDMWTLSYGMWDPVPWPGIKPTPLPWEHQVPTTGPPGKSFCGCFWAGWFSVMGTVLCVVGYLA